MKYLRTAFISSKVREMLQRKCSLNFYEASASSTNHRGIKRYHIALIVQDTSQKKKTNLYHFTTC